MFQYHLTATPLPPTPIIRRRGKARGDKEKKMDEENQKENEKETKKTKMEKDNGYPVSRT